MRLTWLIASAKSKNNWPTWSCTNNTGTNQMLVRTLSISLAFRMCPPRSNRGDTMCGPPWPEARTQPAARRATTRRRDGDSSGCAPVCGHAGVAGDQVVDEQDVGG